MKETNENLKGWLLSVGLIRGALPVLELVGCFLLLAIFWGYYQQSNALPPPYNPIDIGAGGFPRLLAIMTLISIACVIVAAVIRLFSAASIEWISVTRPLWVGATMALLIAQSIWFESLGALPSVFFFSVVTMFACGEHRPMQLLAIPTLLVGFIYSVFILALAVNLP